MQPTDDLDRLVDEVTSPGDGVHRCGAKALGAGMAPLLVTIDTNLEKMGA